MPGPVDPRLLEYTRATRRYLVATVLVGGFTAALVVAQAWLIANTVARVVSGHQALAQVRTLAALLLVVIVGRAAVGWLGERMAARASSAAKSDLRQALVERVARPRDRPALDRQRPGSLVVLATSGIDALDGYFARYLPQLFLAVIVPVTVIVVVVGADWLSAVLIAVTVPLIPVFMALGGRLDQGPDGRVRPAFSSGWPATSSTWWPACPPSRSSAGPRPRWPPSAT